MNKSYYKISITLLYFLILYLLSLYIGGVYTNDYCTFLKNRHIVIIFIFFLPFLIGQAYVHLMKIKKSDEKNIFRFGIYIPFLILTSYYSKNNAYNYLDKNPVIISKGVIEKKYHTKNRSYWIEGKFYVKKRETYKKFIFNYHRDKRLKSVYKKLLIGDTILIKYAYQCEKFYKIYKFFPTKEELKRLKKR